MRLSVGGLCGELNRALIKGMWLLPFNKEKILSEKRVYNRIIVFLGVLCVILLAVNAYLLTEHSKGGLKAISAMHEIQNQNRAVHVEMMQEFKNEVPPCPKIKNPS